MHLPIFGFTVYVSTMYRVVLLVVGVAVISKADIDEKCAKIFHPDTMFCCVKPPPKPSDDLNLKECFGLPAKPFSTCEQDACIAKKKGYTLADGNIDKKAVKEVIQGEFEKLPEFVELIKDKCLDGDLNTYAPNGFCDSIKLRNCMQLQFVMQCPEFSDEGGCSGIKALVDECFSSS